MKALLATLLLLLAATVGVLELVALLDPVGTKLADDGDPFGDPRRSWISHAVAATLILTPVAAALLLMRSRKKR